MKVITFTDNEVLDILQGIIGEIGAECNKFYRLNPTANLSKKRAYKREQEGVYRAIRAIIKAGHERYHEI